MEPGLNVFVTLAFAISALFASLSTAEALMSVAKEKTRLKTFRATMVVSRLEEWCVDPATAEEARALLAAGQGHRCHLGDCLHVELQDIEDGT